MYVRNLFDTGKNVTKVSQLSRGDKPTLITPSFCACEEKKNGWKGKQMYA
jgi:hypothetical protein